MDMFRQIAPEGVVKKEAVDKSLSPEDAIDSEHKAEIDQHPHPAENQKAADAEKLVEGSSCPFAGTNPKEAVAPFPPAEVNTAKSEGGRIAHPNLPLSASTMEVLESGEQEGVGQCPFISTAPKSGP